TPRRPAGGGKAAEGGRARAHGGNFLMGTKDGFSTLSQDRTRGDACGLAGRCRGAFRLESKRAWDTAVGTGGSFQMGAWVRQDLSFQGGENPRPPPGGSVVRGPTSPDPSPSAQRSPSVFTP